MTDMHYHSTSRTRKITLGFQRCPSEKLCHILVHRKNVLIDTLGMTFDIDKSIMIFELSGEGRTSRVGPNV